MRLICPNCGAQYEVDARVIPDTGRDVQCSNCGHTWFQNPEHMDADLAEEMGYEVTPSADEAAEQAEQEMPQFDEEPDDITPEDAPDLSYAEEETAEEPTVDAFDTESETETPDAPDDGIEDTIAEMLATEEADDGSNVGGLPPAAAATPRASQLSDSVKDILRSEVEYDQSLRQGDESQLETQPDLGIEEPVKESADKSLRDRMARLRGLDPADSGGKGGLAAAMGKRRDLLPDIEEIKSTLSASSERDEDGSVPDEETRSARAKRSGKRGSFLFIIVLIALAILLYIAAPFLAGKLPALAPILESYVSGANAVRDGLDALMSSASARLNDLLGQLSG